MKRINLVMAGCLLLSTWGCNETEPAPTPAEATGVDAVEGTLEPEVRDGCPVPPALAGEEVILLKGPYLQAPEPEGITIAYETNLEIEGAVIVWDDDPTCPVAVVKTAPTKMSTFYEPLGIQMDDTPG
ncbi:MAG: hypothetical protein VX938_09700, partial [Myxococcota bacterium]|nr:hypothetical protein [Myxococcota bacterium]